MLTAHIIWRNQGRQSFPGSWRDIYGSIPKRYHSGHHANTCTERWLHKQLRTIETMCKRCLTQAFAAFSRGNLRLHHNVSSSSTIQVTEGIQNSNRHLTSTSNCAYRSCESACAARRQDAESESQGGRTTAHGTQQQSRLSYNGRVSARHRGGSSRAGDSPVFGSPDEQLRGKENGCLSEDVMRRGGHSAGAVRGDMCCD